MCRDGRLKVGDRILEINGADATKVPLSDAYDMLINSGASVTLLVEYNVSVIGRNLSLSLSLSVLTAIFPGKPRLAGFVEAKDDGGGGDNWTTGAISREKLQSNHNHQQTNTQ